MFNAKDVEKVWDHGEYPIAAHEVGELDWGPFTLPNLIGAPLNQQGEQGGIDIRIAIRRENW
jgi:hypothetical protein